MPAEMNERLTVIVPCLNEEANVEGTVDSIWSIAPELDVEIHLYLIDDGSTDGTRAVLERLHARRPERCQLQINPQNMGLGRSVTEAYERIPPDSWATVMPGDNEFIFASIKNFLAIRRDHDIILGYLKNSVIRRFWRRMASDGFTRLANLLYGFDFRYFNGLKMYRVRCFQGLEIVSGGHAFNPELLAKAVLRDPTLRVGEAPFLIRGRQHGVTKAFTPSAIGRAVEDMYRGYQAVNEYRELVLQSEDV